jgi:hypothetical protein
MVLPTQSSLLSPYPTNTEAATVPRLGIILDVIAADDPKNRSAQQFQSFRGTSAEATVYLPEAGNLLYHVIITPDIASGMDDFYEKFPRKVQTNIKGKAFSINDLASINLADLDGDWCVVDFLNGRVNQPYVQRWWPSPRNFYDNATSGKGNPILGAGKGRALNQKGRVFTRQNGVEYVVTPEGDVFFSTKLAGTKLKADNQGAATDRVARESSGGGGSILVNIKDSESLDISFDKHPDGVGPGMVYSESLPQKNPNSLGALPLTRSNTHIKADKSGVTVEVPVNFKIESDGSIVETALTSIEVDAPLIKHGSNAVQFVALAQDTIDAISRLESIMLAISAGASAGVAGATPAEAAFKTFCTALQTAFSSTGLTAATKTLTVAATKVKAE